MSFNTDIVMRKMQVMTIAIIPVLHKIMRMTVKSRPQHMSRLNTSGEKDMVMSNVMLVQMLPLGLTHLVKRKKIHGNNTNYPHGLEAVLLALSSIVTRSLFALDTMKALGWRADSPICSLPHVLISSLTAGRKRSAPINRSRCAGKGKHASRSQTVHGAK